jgi:hypothetical protein
MVWWDKEAIEVLIGKTLVDIDNQDDESLIFTLDNEDQYIMYHDQDCCETVLLEDIAGDLGDLLNSPIVRAEEVTSVDKNPPGVSPPDQYRDESFTWTFYKLATVKGSVTLRWYGTSNGYYSEEVCFTKR